MEWVPSYLPKKNCYEQGFPFTGFVPLNICEGGVLGYGVMKTAGRPDFKGKNTRGKDESNNQACAFSFADRGRTIPVMSA